MFNFLEKIRANPGYYRQLSVNQELITEFNCPLENDRETMWTDQSYFVYVIDGKKIWHIPGKSFELTKGRCIFVRKGAHVVEQFFDTPFCVLVFFVSDSFIRDTLLQHRVSLPGTIRDDSEFPISEIHADESLEAFFNSVVPYFLEHKNANKSLLELKFRELILNVVYNSENTELKKYFCSLIGESSQESVKKIMENNFCYNLQLEDFAKMCGRSLSAFKRDFLKIYQTTPGRWLLQRRLQQAEWMLTHSNKSISEIAFDCGFENTSHFSRAFKSRFGHPPAQHKKSRPV